MGLVRIILATCLVGIVAAGARAYNANAQVPLFVARSADVVSLVFPGGQKAAVYAPAGSAANLAAPPGTPVGTAALVDNGTAETTGQGSIVVGATAVYAPAAAACTGIALHDSVWVLHLAGPNQFERDLPIFVDRAAPTPENGYAGTRIELCPDTSDYVLLRIEGVFATPGIPTTDRWTGVFLAADGTAVESQAIDRQPVTISLTGARQTRTVRVGRRERRRTFARLAGQLRAAGEPVPGASVQIIGTPGKQVREGITTTGYQGRYGVSVPLARRKTFTAQASTSSWVTWADCTPVVNPWPGVDPTCAGTIDAGASVVSREVPVSPRESTVSWSPLTVSDPAGTPPTVVSDGAAWTQFGFGPAHGGWNAGERELSPSSVRDLQMTWSADLPAAIAGPPATADGVVYAAARDGLHAFDVRDGHQLSLGAGDGALSPAVSEHTVYAGRLAFSRSTGMRLWESAVSPGSPGSPTLASDTLFVTGAADTSGLAALDAVTGRPVWVREELHCAFSTCSPALAGGRLYATAGGPARRPHAAAYALDPRTGATRWRRTFGRQRNHSIGSPLAASGHVYVPVSFCRPCRNQIVWQHFVYALHPRKGAIRWRAAVGRPRYLPNPFAAADGSRVYYASTDGRLYAIGARDGKRRWSVRTGLTDATPTIAGGVVFLAVGQRVIGLDARNGRRLLALQLQANVASSPIVAGGALYVGAGTRLYRFAPSET